MFTGIVKEVGTVRQIRSGDGGKIFHISCTMAAALTVDQSISINGACHTVTRSTSAEFETESVPETLRKTTMGLLQQGDSVNLERSIRADQLLDGHIVQGHVDTTGTITGIVAEGDDRLITVAYPPDHASLVVGRGSICVDGISLTVADEHEHSFRVAVIPYTWEHTALSGKRVGDRVNLEFDVLGKYVARYLDRRGGS